MSVGPRRRVSYSQLEALWEALNRNRSLATGFNKTSQARETSRQMWETVAETLNSIGDGATKDHKGWCKYWNDYKSKLKARVAAARSSLQRTGGGPSNDNTLQDIEKKFLQILGEDFGSGIPDARVEPFDDSPPIEQQSQQGQGSESLLSQWPYPELQVQQQPPATPPPAPPVVLLLPAATTPRRSPRLMSQRASPAAIAGPSSQYTPRRVPIITPPPQSQSTPRPVLTRQRLRRGEPPMTQQAARRALVAHSSDRTQLAREKLEVLKDLVGELREIKHILASRLPLPATDVL